VRRTTDEWVDRFARMPIPQDFEPGTSWHYSNTGYYLLGGVIERVEEKSLAAVLKDRFFTPLGMTLTALDDERDIVPGRAMGYDADPQVRFRNAECYATSWAAAAGAMRSTASDLIRWNNALFGGKVLQASSFEAMIAPGKLDDGRLSSSAIEGEDPLAGGTYGYGLVIGELDGHAWVGHAGGIDGFSSFLTEFPDDGITVAINANSSMGAFKVAERIHQIVIGGEGQR